MIQSDITMGACAGEGCGEWSERATWDDQKEGVRTSYLEFTTFRANTSQEFVKESGSRVYVQEFVTWGLCSEMWLWFLGVQLVIAINVRCYNKEFPNLNHLMEKNFISHSQ